MGTDSMNSQILLLSIGAQGNPFHRSLWHLALSHGPPCYRSDPWSVWYLHPLPKLSSYLPASPA